MGLSPTRGSRFFFEKMTVSGELCCVALFFCCVVVALSFSAFLGVIVHAGGVCERERESRSSNSQIRPSSPPPILGWSVSTAHTPVYRGRGDSCPSTPYISTHLPT